MRIASERKIRDIQFLQDRDGLAGKAVIAKLIENQDGTLLHPLLDEAKRLFRWRINVHVKVRHGNQRLRMIFQKLRQRFSYVTSNNLMFFELRNRRKGLVNTQDFRKVSHIIDGYAIVASLPSLTGTGSPSVFLVNARETPNVSNVMIFLL